MKRGRVYKAVLTGFSDRQKTVYILDSEEQECLRALWDANELREFDYECRLALDLHDIPSRFDGDWYERFEFYLTEHNRLIVVDECGYSV